MTRGAVGSSRARGARRRAGETGVALVLCLLFMLAVSVVGASLAVLAQTESYASINYRMMSQARYGAEAGVNKAINALLNGYVQPGGPGDPLSNYNTTVSPVTYNGQPVVLSAMAGVASNYPLASAQTFFNTAAQGTLAAGAAKVNYAASATLMSMNVVMAYGSGTTSVVQTWRVTGDGSISGSRTALVEVSALLEQQTVPAHTYAAFATNGACGALAFSGGVVTDSYDSSNFTKSGGRVVTQSSGGNVGTNGNLNDSGGSTINGALYTPRSGVGNCSNGSVDALTQTGGVVQLPQALTYVAPALPSPLPPVTNVNVSSNTTCAGAGIPAGNCSGSGGNLTLNPNGGVLTLGNLSVSGGATIHVTAGSYAWNSINLSGGATLVVDSGPAVINVVGTGQATPLNFSGGSVSNASINLSGGTDFYGSLLGATLNVSGGAKVHYHRHLSTAFFTVGNQMLSSFTWKKY
jgi:hypothetical protein